MVTNATAGTNLPYAFGGQIAMLPKNLRLWLFDVLSVQTMRYVHAVPRHEAAGLVAEVYDMITEDFFINGSLSSRSKVPPLLAAMWTAGRESILVNDRLDRTTKEAMTAVLSQINDCPYCGDMLIGLVHAGKEHEAARKIFAGEEGRIADSLLRERLAWVKSVATPGRTDHRPVPFTAEELPEAIAALMAMSDINRFSHVVMDGSPVDAPRGLQSVKKVALRVLGNELESTQRAPVPPGRALSLLPPAPLPDDLWWAEPNERVAAALARWATTVENEASGVVPAAVRDLVSRNLHAWTGEQMPLSRSWVDAEVAELSGPDQPTARLALVLAKAPYQVDETLVQAVVRDDPDEERFIRMLAWMSSTAARRFAQGLATEAWRSLEQQRAAA